MSLTGLSLRPKTKTPPPPTFLTLPAELRNQIYTHVFSDHTHVKELLETITSTSNPHELSQEHYANNLSLLLVNRQIHHEAQHLAFRLTTFLISQHVDFNLPHLLTLPSVSTSILSLVTSLTLLSTVPPANWYPLPLRPEPDIQTCFTAVFLRQLPAMKDIVIIFTRHYAYFRRRWAKLSTVGFGSYVKQRAKSAGTGREKAEFRVEKRTWPENVTDESYLDCAEFVVAWDDDEVGGERKFLLRAEFPAGGNKVMN